MHAGSGEAAPDARGWHRVPSPACAEGERLNFTLEGRFVTVLRRDSKLFALDSVCFHAGGPLALGDIEELNGGLCIVCPFHKSHVCLETGDKLVQVLRKDAEGRLVPGEWRSMGKRQRIHHVEERSDGLYVRLNLTEVGADGQPLPSDAFARKAECGQRLQHGASGTASNGIPMWSYPKALSPSHSKRSLRARRSGGSRSGSGPLGASDCLSQSGSDTEEDFERQGQASVTSSLSAHESLLATSASRAYSLQDQIVEEEEGPAGGASMHSRELLHDVAEEDGAPGEGLAADVRERLHIR